MSGISSTLDIGKTTLLTSQLAMEVTSNNVANANTEGYSKEVLVLTPRDSISIAAGQLGTGVTSDMIARMYDKLINDQVVDKNSDFEYWSTKKANIENVETIITEDEDYGVNYLMGEFWNAWSDLANNPTGLAERQSLIGKAQDLIQTIYNIDSDLRSTQINLDRNIQSGADAVNAICSEIADLNQRITEIECGDVKNSANALRDQRDQLLLDLSTYVEVNYYEDDRTGQYNIFILGGTPLVQGKSSYELTLERNTTSGNTDVVWNGSSGVTRTITNAMDSGKLAGWVDLRNDIDDYLDTVNTLASELVYQVNEIHSLGTGLESMSSMTGTELITDATLAIDGTDANGDYYYAFGDRFASGSFDINVYDANGDVVNTGTVTLAAGDTVNDLIAGVSGVTNMTASVDADGHLNFSTTTAGYTFSLSENATTESNHALAVLGMNSFFTWSTIDGDLTETMAVNADIINNSDLIAAGRISSNGTLAEGDNTNAISIADLQNAVLTIEGRNTTMTGYYSSFVSEVGVDVMKASTNENYYKALLEEYTSKKDSISGVNLDEEMTDLLRYQQMYQAAAKVITSADEMMQTLLSMKQ